jgi:hypothetical protein
MLAKGTIALRVSFIKHHLKSLIQPAPLRRPPTGQPLLHFAKAPVSSPQPLHWEFGSSSVQILQTDVHLPSCPRFASDNGRGHEKVRPPSQCVGDLSQGWLQHGVRPDRGGHAMLEQMSRRNLEHLRVLWRKLRKMLRRILFCYAVCEVRVSTQLPPPPSRFSLAGSRERHPGHAEFAPNLGVAATRNLQAVVYQCQGPPFLLLFARVLWNNSMTTPFLSVAACPFPSFCDWSFLCVHRQQLAEAVGLAV